MKRVFLVTCFPVLFLACNSSSTPQPPAKYEEKKASLEEIEKGSPLKFLRVQGSHHRNLVNQAVVTGEITNKATLVSYKNITLRISWLDKDGAVIEKQKEVLDDVVKPNSTIDFKIKTNHVKGTESVSMDIVSAIADK